jgi:hypothetical protein
VQSNDCERRFSACQRLGMLKLQCFEHQRRFILRSELVRRVDERFLHRRTQLQLRFWRVSIFIQFCH